MARTRHAINFVVKKLICFIRWWIVEVQELIPLRFCRIFVAQKYSLVLHPEKDGMRAVLMRELKFVSARQLSQDPSLKQVETFQQWLKKETGASSLKHVLALDGQDVFIFDTEYPLTAEAHLEQILPHELDLLTPFKSEDVFWDWHILERKARDLKIKVRLAVVKRSFIERVMSWLKPYGLYPKEVLFAKNDEAAHIFHRLLPSSPSANATRLDRLNQHLNAALVLSFLFLGGSYLYVLERQETFLEKALQDRQPKIERFEKKKGTLERLKEVAKAIEDQRMRPSELEILETIAKALPDDTWVFDFHLNGEEIKISGFSKDPAELIGIIDAQDIFDDVKFLSPVTTAVEGKGQRFEMSFQIKNKKRDIGK